MGIDFLFSSCMSRLFFFFLLRFSPKMDRQNMMLFFKGSFSSTINEINRCEGSMKDAHPSHLKVLEEQRGSPSFLCVVR